MPYHHLAVATRDMRAIDIFYTQAMGFDLVKCEVGATPAGGWAKHFFYDTGEGEMMAFWELHDETLPSDFPTSLSGAAGLPEWTNHIAFHGTDAAGMEKHKERLLEHGYGVMEIDHHWCHSIYVQDPNGTLVEFCITTGEFNEDDRVHARKALTSDDLKQVSPKSIQFHKAEVEPAHLRS